MARPPSVDLPAGVQDRQQPRAVLAAHRTRRVAILRANGTDLDAADERLRSTYYSPAQLLALGRIAELSALLETVLRSMLATVTGISESATEALFLGDRTSSLMNRIKELAKFADAPGWFATDGLVG